MADLSGQIIKGYEIRKRLGAGSFGAVYQAFQPVIGREVAIKVILPQFANQPDFIRRFETEAQFVARLEHPHIVPLFDYWREPDSAYLVMRMVRGGSLADLLKRGALELDLAARLLDQMAGALSVAHRAGVIHSDFKPDNVLVDEDYNAYLTDFGLATVIGVQPGDEDMISGTPAYMAPEQLQGRQLGPEADIYALGFTLYEMVTGRHPFKGSSVSELVMKQLNENIPDIDLDTDLPPAVNNVLQKATYKNPAERYNDAREMASAFRRAIQVQTEVESMVIIDITLDDDDEVGANPYKGLRPFEEADAANFFGREALTMQLIERLCEQHPFARFLAVVGPSGSGKSSAVKAGLLPALRRGRMDGSEGWFITEMVPGTNPVENLAAALRGVANRLPDDLTEQLLSHPRALVRAVNLMLPDPDSDLLMVIDQFEEVFTVADDAIREQFLTLLRAAITEPDSRIRVIVTLRADFYDRPLLYEGFAPLMQARTQVVLPLNAEEIERAIVGPAERAGLRVDTDLVAAIVSDVREEPGALPLLQYALTEVYERRDGRTLTLEGYQHSGGVLGALARRADEVYADLPEAQQALARQLFLRLVTLGEGTEDTRRRAQLSELQAIFPSAESLNELLGAFTRYRLLTTDQDPETRAPTVEVAHEALIREWKRLREWLDLSREDVRLQRLLAAATQEWNNAGRAAGFLLSGGRLAQFDEWSKTTDIALAESEREYIVASVQERNRRRAAEIKRQQKEKALERRARRVLTVLAAVLLVAACGGFALTAVAINRSQAAVDALGEANVRGTEVAYQAGTAQAEAINRATQQQLAVDGGATALAAQAQALDAANQQATAAQIALDQGATATFAQGQAIEAADSQATAAQIALDQGATATVAQGQAVIEAGNAQTQAAIASTNEANAQEQSNQRATQEQIAIQNATEAAQNAHQASTAAAVAARNEQQAVAAAATSNYNATQSAISAANAMTSEANSRLAADQRATQQRIAEQNATQAANSANERATAAANAARNEATAIAAAATSNYNATQSAISAANAMTSEANSRFQADQRATQQYIAEQNATQSAISANAAATSAAQAAQNEATAIAAAATSSFNATLSAQNAGIALTNEANAVDAQATAQRQSTISQSLALAASARANAEIDRPLAMHLALLSSNIPNPPVDAQAALAQVAHMRGVRQIYYGMSVNAAVMQTAFNADGSRISSLGSDYTLVTWDTNTGEVLSKITFPHIDQPDLSPDASYLVGAHGAADGVEVYLWDVAQPLAPIDAFTVPASVYTLKVGRGGSIVVTGNDDSTVTVWRAVTGDICVLGAPNNTDPTLGHTEPILLVSISDDGTRVLTMDSSNRVIVWNIASSADVCGTISVSFSAQNTFNHVVFTPDGLRIVASLYNVSLAEVHMYDVDPASGNAGTITGKFSGHAGVYEVAISPDGYTLLTSSYTSMQLWDFWTQQNIATFGSDQVTISFSPDSQMLLTADYSESTIRRWEFRKGQVSGYFPNMLSSPAMIYGVNDEYVFYGDFFNAQTIRLNHLPTDTILWEKVMPGLVYALDIQRPLALLAAVDSDGTLGVWQFDPNAPGTLLTERTANLGVTVPYAAQVKLDPSGHRALVAIEEGGVFLVNTDLNSAQFGQILFTFPAAVYRPVAAISPDGRYALTADFGNNVQLWDFDPLSPTYLTRLHTFAPHPVPVYHMAFSPDSKQAIVGMESALYVWNSDRSNTTGFGQVIRQIAVRGAKELGESISPDGNYTAYHDWYETAVYLMHIPTGQIVQTYDAHQYSPGRVAFSPSGNHVLSVGSDGAIVWRNTRLAATIDWVCANRYFRPLTAAEKVSYGVAQDYQCAGLTNQYTGLPPSEIVVALPTAQPTVTLTPPPTATLSPGLVDDGYWIPSNAWTQITAQQFDGITGTGWLADSAAGESLLTWVQPLDLSAFSAPELQFLSMMSSLPGVLPEVQVSTDGATWTTVAVPLVSAGFTEQGVPLPRESAVWVRLRWQATGRAEDFWAVDELRFVDAPLPPPQEIGSTPEPGTVPELPPGMILEPVAPVELVPVAPGG